MNELFIYDRDLGLFKELLKHSSVMQGRYHIAPGYGSELNTGNIDAIIKDPAIGLTDAGQKYPCCVCMTPVSNIVERNGSQWERFVFNLYFLCTTYYTGDNQVKQPDPGTGVSTHHVWYDWKDMVECGHNFMKLLDTVIRRKYVVIDEKEQPLGLYFNLDNQPHTVKRLSKFNNDRLSGCGISFVAYMHVGGCDIQDYADDVLDKIAMPPTTIHPIHNH